MPEGQRSWPAAAACLRELTGEGWVLESVVARRDNSRIHRARRGSQTAAIKECFSHATMSPDSAAAEREFAALTTLAGCTRQSGGQPLAPEPLVLCREYAVYAMTWVPGRTATQMLLAPSTDRKRAEELGYLAGDWLRRFHAGRALPPRQSDFAARLDYVGQLLEAAGDREPILTRAAGVLGELASTAAALPVPASWVHGDMKSDNLLVDGGNVTGLDIQLVDDNTVAYDLAPFLNYLCLLRWSPRGFVQREKIQRMAAGFLRAYSPDSGRWSLPLLWLRAYLLLQTVAPSARSMSWQAWAAQWPARRELASAVLQLEKWPAENC